MDNKQVEAKIARISAFWYTAISLLVAAVFYFAASGYPAVARWGGFFWVFLLTLIVTMPMVIPYVKKKYGNGQ